MSQYERDYAKHIQDSLEWECKSRVSIRVKIDTMECYSVTGPTSGSTAQPKLSTSKLNVGAIIGIVIGVITPAILVVAGVIIFRNKRKKGSKSATFEEDVVPYPRTTSTSQVTKKQESLDLDHIQRSCLDSHGEQDAAVRERRVVYLEDSGWRPSPLTRDADDSGSSVVVMPPRYDAAV
ncbi:hypothetical protein VNI00_017298 [Paramarasmius palmivorus]|uniref:Mid2 domain-containing protein n=1 Tax=Paramarasmius palmivorus TaxID=297713 RepID=A0AAW0B854_9AGAR